MRLRTEAFQVLVGAAEPLNNPMGVQLAPDGKLLVVDSAPWLPRVYIIMSSL